MGASEKLVKRWSFGGALIAALAASSCCLGPLALAALGIGGAGATVAIGACRPYLLAATICLLAVGLYFTYRSPRAGADPCGCERPRSGRASRIGPWGATVFVVLVAAAPPVIAEWGDRTQHRTGAAEAAGLSTAIIGVQGIDCEACAAPIRRALAKVGGLHDLEFDIPRQSVTVTYEPAAGRLDAYVAAINGLGYEATLRSHAVGAAGARGPGRTR